MAGISSLAGLVFSRDRAMQLDATLRSFLLHCVDGDDARLTVLYQVTSASHARQYAELIQEYRSYRTITFQQQAHFRQDVLGYLAAHADLRYGSGLYHHMARLHHRLGFLSQPLLRFGSPRDVLFLVDDNIFVRSFCLADNLSALEAHSQALGYSLRLGRNTTFCYTRDRVQSLPEFTSVGEGVLCYDWRGGELDFAYPLEVSSSIYRIADLLPLLNRLWFSNPNQLESRLAENAIRFTNRPFLLCNLKSVVFSNPVNQVAERHQNRFGNSYHLTTQELADNFSNGLRIDINRFAWFYPKWLSPGGRAEFLPFEHRFRCSLSRWSVF